MGTAQESIIFKPPYLDSANELTSHLSEVIWKLQRPDGHWHFALDDNVIMNAEYILFLRWLNLHTQEAALIKRLAQYILNQQQSDGAWRLFFGGPGELSSTVEAYFALRVAGYPQTHPALLKAREFILSQGGIPQCRVFTKTWLALFGLFPWKGVPIIPPEILLAPRAIPFNILEFSYWSRVTIIPLTILYHLQKETPVDFTVDELYLHSSDKLKTDFLIPKPVDDSWIVSRKISFNWINWEQVFIALNMGVTVYEERSPYKPMRAYCLERARRWILEHQEKDGGWGGIQPPMLNSIMALHALGMDLKEEPIQRGLKAIKEFTRGISKTIPARSHEDSSVAVLQSCNSPIWDTALAALGLLEAGVNAEDERLQRTKRFLWEQRTELKGDWYAKSKLKRNQPIAAWSFQYENRQFPDIDDSCVVALVLHRLGMSKEELKPALNWLWAMQNTDGGWGTFDRDNNQVILNRIPFADLKALIDPSNADVTGHVLETLGDMGYGTSPQARRAVRYMKRTQKAEGSWFGRWGVSYIYGTSAAVVGLRKVGEPASAPYLQRAIKFLLSKQNEDGGWGEDCRSYELHAEHGRGHSTPSQTAWALLAIQACRENSTEFSEEISRALQFLKSRQVEDGLFEEEFTGTGFPEHFYLRYDGYRNFWPLIALGRILNS